MGLGNRYTSTCRAVTHDTAALRALAVNAELWHEFREGQRVRTVDGITGVIAAVEDGPVPGNEQYVVELDRGLGGGAYTASQLTALGPTRAATEHTAADDYPELGSILVDRPDIAKSASHQMVADALCARCNQEPGSNRWLGREGCPSCGGTLPFQVEVKGNRVHIDGKPWSHDGGDPQYSSFVDTYQGKGEATIVDRQGREHFGTGDSELDAAHNAMRSWKAKGNMDWEPRPPSYFDKVLRRNEK